ncbi:MAG: hypothetical protein ACUVUD_00055 [bacterium]
MNLFERLTQGKKVKIIAGLKITAVQQPNDTWQFSVDFPLAGEKSDNALLALHYLSHILARYPKEESRGYEMATKIRTMLTTIVNEGVWPDSDLIRYADARDKIVLLENGELVNGETISAALIFPPGSGEPDLVLEEPIRVTDEGLAFSVVAVLQAILKILDPETVERFDRALRYFNSYLDEGASCSDPATACNLANRAFKEST